MARAIGPFSGSEQKICTNGRLEVLRRTTRSPMACPSTDSTSDHGMARDAGPNIVSLIPLSFTSTTLRRWMTTAKISIPTDPPTGAASEYPANAAARPKINAIGRTVTAMRIPKLAY